MRETVYLLLLCTILELWSNLNFAAGKVIRSNENMRITHNSEFPSDLQHLAIDRFSGNVSNTQSINILPYV